MDMIVDGLFVDENNGPGSSNVLNGVNPEGNFIQPFHFHNQPQDRPDFYVQQLYDTDASSSDPTAPTTATLENTDTGLRFTIDEPYAMRDPINNPDLTTDFVIDTIRRNDGTAYLGLHTSAEPIPETALAGDMIVLLDGGIDGKVRVLGDEANRAFGTYRDDLLTMGGGNDRVFALNGDDTIDGGIGNDRLHGGRGDDVAWGGDGRDVLRGGWGDDHLFGGRGSDRLRGGANDDKLEGGEGDDRLWGQRGDDYLDGGEGNDRYVGGAGADTFILALGNGTDRVIDFERHEGDLLGLAGGLTFNDLAIAQDGDEATVALREGAEDLAIVVTDTALVESDFIMVA